MRKALVEPSGRVAEVRDSTFPVHPSLVWRDCPDDTTTNHRWDGATFVAPPARNPPPPVRDPLAEVDALRKAVIRKGHVTQAEIDAEKS